MIITSDPVVSLLRPPETADLVPGSRWTDGFAPSVYLWGSSRPSVNLVLYAMAGRIDSEFAWLQVSDRGAPDEVDRLLMAGWKRPRLDRVAMRAEELLPRPEVEHSFLRRLLDDEGENGEAEMLRQFVTLPPLVQQVVSRHVPHPGTKVLAIPNADRLADLYVGRPFELESLLRVLEETSVSLLVGRSNGPGPLRQLFQYVMEVRVPDLDSWPEGLLIVERAPSENAEFVGQAFSLGQLSWAEELFEQLPSSVLK
jgi:hypothetical protein